jgi:hypothetical protein
MLANQMNPQIMADAIVQLVLAEEHKFRNVVPKATEEWLKQTQKGAREVMS